MQNLKLLFLFMIFLASTSVFAQETYIIEGDTLQLKQEVKGTLNLFRTNQDSIPRFFVQKGDRMLELRNIPENGIPQYKQRLDTLTSDTGLQTIAPEFKLNSLKQFAIHYNERIKEDAASNIPASKLQKRLGFFTGLSNNIYTENPENLLAPIIGVEFEIYDPKLSERHLAFTHLRHSFQRTEFNYSSTQLSLNYRVKFIYTPTYSLHLDTELVTFQYSKKKIPVFDNQGDITDVEEDNGFSLTAPLSFGVGGDFRVTDQSFISVSYNDIVAVFLDTNGSFPIDFTLGYKYNL